MINLGLARVSRLLAALGNPHQSWKAIHVAGTNGKGSVCAYISSCLDSARISNGRFTSPHLLERWDSISVNGSPVTKGQFLEVENLVQKINSDNSIGATEFELLTVVAFEIFKRSQVRLAVIEVGLGGRLDSTNVLEPSHTICSVITKIGLDHQNFLGNTIAEIAREKAGIIKAGVPVVVDGTNDATALGAIEMEASKLFASLQVVKPLGTAGASSLFHVDPGMTPLLGSYQLANLSCALHALVQVKKEYPEITDATVQEGIQNTKWPGRLQKVQIGSVKVLADGAHNTQAAEQLAEYINVNIRKSTDEKITFILAFSRGKDFEGILELLVRPGDLVVATKFGSVDGMPWVSPCETSDIVDQSSKFTDETVQSDDIASALKVASESNRNIVVCGSLYLVSELLRQSD